MTEILNEEKLKEVAHHLLSLAKLNFERFGHVEPVGFLFTEDGMKGALLRFDDRESKVACIKELKKLVSVHNAYAVVMITEAWAAPVLDEAEVALAGEIGVEFMPNRKEQINVSLAAPYLRLCIVQEIDTSEEGVPKIIGEPYEMVEGIEGVMFDGLWDAEYNMMKAMKKKEVN